MKQLLILEAHEIARLERGKTLLLSTSAGEIAIQFERGSSQDDDDRSKRGKGVACDICGQDHNKNTGKPFNEAWRGTRPLPMAGKRRSHDQARTQRGELQDLRQVRKEVLAK